MSFQISNWGNASGTAAMPKYLQICATTKDAIDKGVLKPGERIPSCREMAKMLNVTTFTVCRAIETLRHERILETIQGKGTFVSQASNEKNADEGIVGVFGSTSGHFYGPMFGQIMNRLHYRKIMVVESELMIGEKEAQLENILKSNASALLIDGDVNFPFDKIYFSSNMIETITFFHRFESLVQFPSANMVLPDYEEGGRMAAQHLIDKGVKSLLFNTFRFPGAPDDNPMGPPYAYHWGAWKGIRRALDDSGLDPKKSLTVATGTKTDGELSGELSKVEAVICMNDSRAVNIYRVAAQIGRKIGEDLKVVGFFNTPWATAMSPDLTSVSIREDEIATQAVKTLEEKQRGLKTLIKPELKTRCSG